METKFVLGLTITEKILLRDDEDGKGNGNGAWVTHEELEWAHVDDFDARAAAEKASMILSKLHENLEGLKEILKKLVENNGEVLQNCEYGNCQDCGSECCGSNKTPHSCLCIVSLAKKLLEEAQ